MTGRCPTRPDYISGKHCEIHYRNNGYWLHDVSTNGTFLNGSDQRVRSPHQLQQGDRLTIGQYIIAVSIDQDLASASQPEPGGSAKPQRAPYGELWDFDQEAAPPIDRRQVMSPREAARPVNSDFLDWAAAVPDADPPPMRPRAHARRPDDADMEWSHGTPSPPAGRRCPPCANSPRLAAHCGKTKKVPALKRTACRLNRSGRKRFRRRRTHDNSLHPISAE